MEKDTQGTTTLDGGNVSAPFNPEQEIKSLSDRQERDKNLILMIMGGLIVFVVITFWIELSAMHRNYNQDKTILLEMNHQNKDYFDQVLFLNKEFQELKTLIDVLKAKNYLK